MLFDGIHEEEDADSDSEEEEVMEKSFVYEKMTSKIPSYI
jgi:hypothetical protein